MTSQLRVDRISPANTSEIIIDGFSSDQPSFFTEMDGGNQIVSNNVATKVILGRTSSKNVDTANILDSDGAATITADTAGIWRFSGQVNGTYVSSSCHLDKVFAQLFRNGSIITDEGSDSYIEKGGPFGLKAFVATVSLITEVFVGDKIELYGTVKYASSGTASELQIAMRSTNFAGNRISS